jgi:serine/threonine-protein kinase
VGSFPAGASPYGSLDLSGNVWEWVADWFDYDYYHTYPKEDWPDNPTGPDDTGAKVLRGGALDLSVNMRTSSRGRNSPPDDRDSYVGFRCSRGTSP